MAHEEDLFVYDEDDAVRFIRNYLPQELKEKFSDDEINYVVDLIYEFYDSKGYLDDNAEEEADIDEEELIEYVVSNARKNGFSHFGEDDIIFIVQGELEYCDSLGMFD